MTVLASPFTALFSLAWLLARYATRADEAGKKVEELQLASEQDESGAEKTERPKVSSSSVCGSLGRKVLPQLVFWITLAPALLLDGQRASSSTLRDGLLLLAASASFDGCMLPAVFALACSLTLSSTALLPVCASLPVLLCAVQNARKQKTSFLRQTLYLCALLLLLHHIALRSSSSSERHGGSLLSLLSYILQRALTVPGRLAAAFTAVSPLLCVEGNLIGALSRLVNSHFLPFLTSSGGSEATLSSIDAGSGSLLPELGGLGWYVASSVFSRYLPYYRVILALQPLLYVLPLCWRLRKRMDLALVIVMAVATLLDSSATSADGSSTNLTRFPLVAALMLSHSTVVSRELLTTRTRTMMIMRLRDDLQTQQDAAQERQIMPKKTGLKSQTADSDKISRRKSNNSPHLAVVLVFLLSPAIFSSISSSPS